MRRVNLLLMAVLIIFPALTLAEKRINSVVFYLLMLIACAVLVARFRNFGTSGCSNSGIPFGRYLLRYWPLNLAMAGWVIAVAIHQMATGNFQSRYLGAPLRLASFAILCWLFLHLKSKELKLVQWGLVAGAIISMVIMAVETKAGQSRPHQLGGIHIIPFSNIALTMGFLGFLTLGWNQVNNKATIAIRLLALISGGYVSYLSQTRGGWLAYPLFMFAGSMLFWNRHKRQTQSFLIACLIIIGSTAIFNNNVQSRLESMTSDVVEYLHDTNPDTSIGTRFQLWKASWLIFQESPILGVGGGHYQDELRKLSSMSVITEQAATYSHAHNEVLFQTSQYGLFGLASVLLSLFVPAMYFAKEFKCSDPELKTTACMGLSLCLGFCIFGLTDVLLIWKGTATFYVVILAMIFAQFVRRKLDLNEKLNQSR